MIYSPPAIVLPNSQTTRPNTFLKHLRPSPCHTISQHRPRLLHLLPQPPCCTTINHNNNNNSTHKTITQAPTRHKTININSTKHNSTPPPHQRRLELTTITSTRVACIRLCRNQRTIHRLPPIRQCPRRSTRRHNCRMAARMVAVAMEASVARPITIITSKRRHSNCKRSIRSTCKTITTTCVAM